MLSNYPKLADLEDGDLKTTVDSRRVYQSILSDWLNIDSRAPLGKKFPDLSVIANQ